MNCAGLAGHVTTTTKRPITLTEGTNRLVKAEGSATAVAAALKQGRTSGRHPEFWDGKTAGRVVASLKERCGG